MNKALLIVIPIVIVIIVALIFLTSPQGTILSGEESVSPTTETPQTTNMTRTGLRTIGTSPMTTTINKSYICGLQVIDPSAYLEVIRDPDTGEITRVRVEIHIDKTVDEEVNISMIYIDKNNFSLIIRIDPDFIDMLIYNANNTPAPTTISFFIERIPPELESQWKEGTTHTIMIVYVYRGVECEYTFETMIP